MFELLPEILKTRVYAGISAGSMIATQSIRTSSQAILNPHVYHDEMYDELGPKDQSAGEAAKLVDFVLRPHYKSVTFPKVEGDFLEEIVDDVKLPLYAIDDETAIKVVDGKVEIITEGDWKLLTPSYEVVVR